MTIFSLTVEQSSLSGAKGLALARIDNALVDLDEVEECARVDANRDGRHIAHQIVEILPAFRWCNDFVRSMSAVGVAMFGRGSVSGLEGGRGPYHNNLPVEERLAGEVVYYINQAHLDGYLGGIEQSEEVEKILADWDGDLEYYTEQVEPIIQTVRASLDLEEMDEDDPDPLYVEKAVIVARDAMVAGMIEADRLYSEDRKENHHGPSVYLEADYWRVADAVKEAILAKAGLFDCAGSRVRMRVHFTHRSDEEVKVDTTD